MCSGLVRQDLERPFPRLVVEDLSRDHQLIRAGGGDERI